MQALHEESVELIFGYPGGAALLARPDVGDPDRGRDHLGAVGHRLPDHERARVPADRHRARGHPAVRAAGQAG